MRDSQRHTIRASEIRQRLNELQGVETLTDEQRSELDALSGEYRDVEAKLRAALTAEAAESETTTAPADGEARERVELRGRARLGRFLEAAIEGRAVDGAEQEYAAAMGCRAAGQVPLDLFESDRPAAAETRAITPAPATVPQQTPRPTVPFLFERSMAARMGCTFPTVQPGAANFPSITTAPPAAAVAEDGNAPNTAGVIALASRLPKRIAGQFEVRVEDVGQMPSIEDDLRMSLGAALRNQLDEQVIAGTGAGGQLSGLLKVATNVTAESNVVDFATGAALFAALVEGQHAYGWGDLRAIIGSATFGKFAGTYRGDASDDNLFDYLAARLGLLAVSNRVPAVAGDAQKVLVHVAGSGDPIQVPTWAAMDLIVDPYTGARAGKRTITATMLVGDPFVPHGTSQVKELHPKIS